MRRVKADEKRANATVGFFPSLDAPHNYPLMQKAGTFSLPFPAYLPSKISNQVANDIMQGRFSICALNPDTLIIMTKECAIRVDVNSQQILDPLDNEEPAFFYRVSDSRYLTIPYKGNQNVLCVWDNNLLTRRIKLPSPYFNHSKDLFYNNRTRMFPQPNLDYVVLSSWNKCYAININTGKITPIFIAYQPPDNSFETYIRGISIRENNQLVIFYTRIGRGIYEGRLSVYDITFEPNFIATEVGGFNINVDSYLFDNSPTDYSYLIFPPPRRNRNANSCVVYQEEEETLVQVPYLSQMFNQLNIDDYERRSAVLQSLIKLSDGNYVLYDKQQSSYFYIKKEECTPFNFALPIESTAAHCLLSDSNLITVFATQEQIYFQFYLFPEVQSKPAPSVQSPMESLMRSTFDSFNFKHMPDSIISLMVSYTGDHPFLKAPTPFSPPTDLPQELQDEMQNLYQTLGREILIAQNHPDQKQHAPNFQHVARYMLKFLAMTITANKEKPFNACVKETLEKFHDVIENAEFLRVKEIFQKIGIIERNPRSESTCVIL